MHGDVPPLRYDLSTLSVVFAGAASAVVRWDSPLSFDLSYHSGFPPVNKPPVRRKSARPR